MNENSRSNRSHSSLTVSILFGMLGLFSPRGEAAQPRVTLTGHIPQEVRGATRLARAAADERIALTLAVGLDQTLLDQTLESLYGRHAPVSRHYLSALEFAEKFGLAEKRAALKHFAQTNGMTIDAAQDNPLSMAVKVSGLASQVERAFNVQLSHYRAPDGRTFRAQETEPTVPLSLGPHLSAIIGLSNLTGVAHPHYRKQPITTQAATPNAAARSPMAITGGTGAGGYLAPADIKTIYGLSGTALTGSGQRVALFELDGFTPSDITVYKNTFGLANAAVTFMGVDGTTNIAGADAAEVTLDIELVLAVAAGVTEIISYTGPNTGQGVYDTYNQMATDNTAKVVSTSWGLYESGSSGAFRTAESQVFQRMATQGQSLYAASGDNGAYDDGSTLSVDDPASQPYVTGVGGTTLSGSVASPSETTWDGSGGGVSAVWPTPSYQTGISGTASQTFRNVPDVCLNADPATGYAIYLGGTWYALGGTSAAAPLWAGMTALINEQRAQTGAGEFGFANTSLYELGTSTSATLAFRDVTTGNNQFYAAASGYDNATGWGSYKGTALINRVSTVDPFRVSYALSNVYAYPNPWDARIHSNRIITFTNVPLLTNGATVKIFTLSGFWVKTLTASNGSAIWQDLTNDAGERVASGLYFYLVDSGDDHAKGTIAIIK